VLATVFLLAGAGITRSLLSICYTTGIYHEIDETRGFSIGNILYFTVAGIVVLCPQLCIPDRHRLFPS